ncbi:iron complex transport system substrate-binding protein [Microlunatus sagamiharensis]|uniref:Iron complex transport system substrate-binding protein n=1 Tax=Microlunatus sagamiharensis TaxID=546874 RepID=A0A1H2N9M9_9ACTN|nr:ABC transporter substrate-binding protein [Microlunatus sagamiharensis]SDV02193.1 iron complex transport system substrate-binding protein [Microlunatus sagamiharensis]
MTSTTRLSRRSLLAALAATPVLAACGTFSSSGGAAAGGASTSAAASSFTYTDARGKAIDISPVPTNVVAQSSAAAALWDAGIKVKGAYGELRTTDGKLDYQAGNLDLSQVEVIGSSYGEFSVEKLATVAPQLLVDMSFDDKTLWYVDAKVEAQVTALCPTLGVHMLDLDLVGVIEEFTDLAVKLGADPSISASAKSGFDAASATLKDAIAKAGDVKIAAYSFDADNAYIGLPSQSPDLKYFQSLGAKFVPAEAAPTDYFATISLEKLPDYSGDFIIVDARNTYTGYKDTAIWKSLPAVKAGRVFEWKPAAPYSYLSSTPVLTGLTEAYASLGS